MLDALFSTTFRVMRQAARNAKNEISYAEVLDGTGGPFQVPCSVTRRRRKVSTKDRGDVTVDATLLCRADLEGFPEISTETFLTIEDTGETYKVTTVESEPSLAGEKYFKLSLTLSELPVPQVKQDG